MHTACIKKFFGTATLPVLDYTTVQLDELALQIIQDQTSLTGVQPKLSLHLDVYAFPSGRIIYNIFPTQSENITDTQTGHARKQ